MFPLSTVLFPGVTMPLHVFEDRYRALVHHLLTIPDRTARVFGIVAIREGYEVGSHGAQSVHRVGCVAQMTSVEPHADGRFDIEVVGRQRMRLEEMDVSGPYLTGTVDLIEDPKEEREAAQHATKAMETFEAYREQLSELRGADVLDGEFPQDPAYLSYSLASACLLSMRERQSLLEVDTARERLILLRHSLREEMRAMRAVPSLPATEVARTGWSPN
jgi:Lon protease-like protein